jgi:hypothetical protein
MSLLRCPFFQPGFDRRNVFGFETDRRKSFSRTRLAIFLYQAAQFQKELVDNVMDFVSDVSNTKDTPHRHQADGNVISEAG